MIIHPDVYTRFCKTCGQDYDSGDFDDPHAGGLWMQDDCPWCFARQPGHSVCVAPPALPTPISQAPAIPPWVIVA